MTVIINFVLERVLIVLAGAEKPSSVSRLNTSLMTKVFVAQTLNTGVMVLLVRGNYLLDGLLGLRESTFIDFDRSWYTIVGAAITTTLLANIFTVAATNVGLWQVSKFMRCCASTSKMHQAEILALYENAPFDIAARYAKLLTMVFCVMMYNGSMPVLNLCALCYCLVAYWADKIILLRGAARPPAYDTKMPALAAEILLYAVPVHLVYTIVMFGNSCIFPSPSLGVSIADISSIASFNVTAQAGERADELGNAFDRVSKSSTWMLFTFLLLLIGLGIVYTILSAIGSTLNEAMEFLETICCPSRRLKKIAPSDAADAKQWNEASQIIERLTPPASYLLERNPEYRPLAKFLLSDVGTPSSPSKGTLQ
eukprot:gnl/TRDRNA2_/TRDRNA2_171457_c2_seq1.p1 gnl/TRDRNA2_/TRDRNA2_171457_c2~~gnl/TRDRNA2_/TRDRNA2_171457_c2_seq1.p1  ORF type:complete len:368 (+),score=31.66 gnl/TRDRNA2_/TRDRNA2_171457_c2_seq1:2-1105(+)